MAEAKRVRCAIYTRKSSEEGLEQSFNSLHAQREACEAFIVSQRHERWQVLSKHYDDGGFSGGSMERPALKELLADITHGKIDTVVVYKVDRLTRSLSDFAKIVERFDQESVSFVSVTQQFNTTSSMGRLTLNVLLSFAQFEREVTGERIRDKIAASKRKGMWMGGNVPLGYDLKNRQLLVNESEAKTVRYIFSSYLTLGHVSKLKSHLEEKSICSKTGTAFSRGALYHLLRNRLYIGEIPHKGEAHRAQHQPIIDKAVWVRVDEQLRSNIQGEKRVAAAAESLAGFLFDEHGNRYTPTHSTKGGKRYRYYTSQGEIRKDRPSPALKRLPAHELEQVILSHFSKWLDSEAVLTELPNGASRAALGQVKNQWRAAGTTHKIATLKLFLRSITILPDQIEAETSLDHLVKGGTGSGPLTKPMTVRWPLSMKSIRGSATIDWAPGNERFSPALIKMIVRARMWAQALTSGEAKGLQELEKLTGLTDRYISKVLRACTLAPDLVEAALSGQQSAQLTTKQLMNATYPLDWRRQRELFG